MPKKGGKKKKELQGAPSRVPDEVQAISGIAQPPSGIGAQAQLLQKGRTQAREGPRNDGHPSSPSEGQQSGAQQSSSLQPASVSQQRSQASPTDDEWVPVVRGKGPQGQGQGSALGRGEILGLDSRRGQRPRPQNQPVMQGARGRKGENLGLSYGQGQGPRPGQPQQHPVQGIQGGKGGNVGLGSVRGQGTRPGQPPMQSAWGGQRTGEPKSTGQPQQFVQAPKPSYSQPTVQATQQAPELRQFAQTQQPSPSAWGQPRSQIVSPQQVPQSSESATKLVASVEKVTEALTEVSLQKNESTSQALEITGQKKIAIDVSNIPKRPDFNKAGTLGRKITVLTNMMQIVFGPNFVPDVKHYDVQIEPDKPRYLMRKVFKKAQEILFPDRQPAFDGKKNAYAAGLLPFDGEKTIEVTVPNENQRDKKFKVTFKKVADLNLIWLKNFGPGPIPEKSQECIQALDIIFRMAPVLKATPVGRSFFMRQDKPEPLGGGMDCWVGLFQSAVLGWKPFLNVDVAHKGFPTPQPVLDLIKTICGCDGQNGGGGGRPQGRQQGYNRYQNPDELTAELIQKYKEDINRFLTGLKVVYQIPRDKNSKRVQRVNELVTCPRQNSFVQNGHKVSVEQYYELEKKYKIQYPLFPCLWVGGRDRNIHVPLELCTIVEGQATQKKLDEKQTSAMIRQAATGTQDRQKKIMDSVKKIDYNNDPCMQEFGVSVSGKFTEIPARVLDAPALAYKRKIVNVTKGQWNADIFLESTSLISDDNTWTIVNLNFRTQYRELQNFVNQLRERAGSLGVKIGEPASPYQQLDTRRNALRALLEYFDSQKNNKRKLVIVVIPDDKGSYSWVKQASELNVGILTQCVKGKTLLKIEKEGECGKNATVTNILLKINAKLNGINHKIAPQQKHSLPYCLREPCMIVGADVTHPSPDSKDIPSIAAVVASHDPRAFRYNTEIRLQPPKEEIILELAEIMITQLKFFFDKTGYWPRRIIYYRDGVGEGYFNKVLQHELGAMRKACAVIGAEIKEMYEPPTTFLVVQKRHHTRLFPTNQRNSDDKHYNVQAGTIVDTEITHPSDIEFFLVSHASIQGTARPTKYRCLWDDADTSEDEIELLTYYLCHMFTRCTRSVSYPTPTYYAHLAAFRARALTYGVPIDLNNLAQAQRRQLDLKKEVSKGTPMFFV